jgi:phosphoribosylanthranilate isomerase
VDDAAVVLAAATSLRAGVFVDGTRETVAEAADRLGLDVIQLHGSETPEAAHALRSAGRIVWKAVRVKHAADVHAAIERYAGCVDGLLLDGWSAAAAGGTGARFDWAAVAAQRAAWPAGLDLIAAGGLSPENVGRAVAQLAPDVVDVSSGVESAPRDTRFGAFGGRFVPETLMAALDELTAAYDAAQSDDAFHGRSWTGCCATTWAGRRRSTVRTGWARRRAACRST